MVCRKCGGLTEGINVLCYQCQLDIMNEWINGPRNQNHLYLLSDEYDVKVSTIMNILQMFKVLR